MPALPGCIAIAIAITFAFAVVAAIAPDRRRVRSHASAEVAHHRMSR